MHTQHKVHVGGVHVVYLSLLHVVSIKPFAQQLINNEIDLL